MHFLKVAIGDPAHTEALFLDEIQKTTGWYQKWRVISEVEGDIRKLNVQWTQFIPDIADSRAYHPSTKNLRFFWTQNAWTWARNERQMLKMANPVRFLVRAITVNITFLPLLGKKLFKEVESWPKMAAPCFGPSM